MKTVFTTERERREWKLSDFDPSDKDMWRFKVRYVMCEANQLPGTGPTDVDDAPTPAG